MNKVLPIGSVVRLKKLEKPVMICGFLQQSAAKPGLMVDYMGVPYPQGNVNFRLQVGFQMEDIAEVLFEGYRTEEFRPIEMLLTLRQTARKKL